MRRVYQLVPFLESGDAIGDHARRLVTALGDRHAGYIVDRAAPEFAAEARSFREVRTGPDDVLVYHVAHASPMAGWFRAAAGTKVVDYHGVTPPEFLRAWDPGLAVALGRARGEVESLASVVTLGIAHSGYTRSELGGFGFACTMTLPILLDAGRLATPPDPGLLQRLRTEGKGHDWLSVSRMAPNKRIEDIIKAFAVYRRVWCSDARLFLVGRPDTASYDAALRGFVDRLAIEEVHFPGKVTVPELMAYYAAAGVFVSMSEHEGFGVPLLEAMANGVPIVAFDAAAVPETLGPAGILFGKKGYDDVAALVASVLGDEGLRSRLVAAGKARLEEFSPERVAASWVEVLGGLG